jgi:hypothetical protein
VPAPSWPKSTFAFSDHQFSDDINLLSLFWEEIIQHLHLCLTYLLSPSGATILGRALLPPCVPKTFTVCMYLVHAFIVLYCWIYVTQNTCIHMYICIQVLPWHLLSLTGPKRPSHKHPCSCPPKGRLPAMQVPM